MTHDVNEISNSMNSQPNLSVNIISSLEYVNKTLSHLSADHITLNVTAQLLSLITFNHLTTVLVASTAQLCACSLV